MTTRARLTISAATATALTALCLLPLITTEVPFRQAPTLFERLDRGDPDMLQTVLTFGEDE